MAIPQLPKAPEPFRPSSPGASMLDYLKAAFLFPWNLLALFGSAAAVGMTPMAEVLLPLVAAGEIVYLTGLVSMPKFRAAIDARVAGDAPAGTVTPPPLPQPSPLVPM